MTSDYFHYGALAEQNKAVGIDEDTFCNLALQLSSTKVTNTRSPNPLGTHPLPPKLGLSATFRHNKIAFQSGRLFHRFALPPLRTHIDRSAMCNVILYILESSNNSEKGLTILDMESAFFAGELFNKYAQADPTLGLNATEFEMLLSSSHFGSLLLTKQQSEFVTVSNKSTPTYAQIHTHQPQVITREEVELKRDMLHESKVNATSGELVATRLRQLEHQMKQFADEISAEVRLLQTLPEAFSSTNLQLLKRHYAEAKQQYSILLSHDSNLNSQ